MFRVGGREEFRSVGVGDDCEAGLDGLDLGGHVRSSGRVMVGERIFSCM